MTIAQNLSVSQCETDKDLKALSDAHYEQKSSILGDKSIREADGLSLLEQLAESSVAQVSPDVVETETVLERMKTNADRRCRNPKAPILFGRSIDRSMALVHKTKCKCWSCVTCGARNARRAIARCLNHVNTVGGQWYFMTLTAHGNWRGSEASYKNLSSNWHKLRKRMREIHGGQFSYFRVWECHKDGSWHMHFITNAKLPYKQITADDGSISYSCRWLKDNASASGLGYIVDYQPLENAGFVAHYVAKYMAKSIDDHADWLRGMRRFQTSSDWLPLPDLTKETDFEWQYMKNSVHLWYTYYETKDAGMEVYLSSTGQKTSAPELQRFWLGIRKDSQPESNKPFYEQDWFKSRSAIKQ